MSPLFFQFIIFLKHIAHRHSRILLNVTLCIISKPKSFSKFQKKKKILHLQTHSSYNIYIYLLPFFSFFFYFINPPPLQTYHALTIEQLAAISFARFLPRSSWLIHKRANSSTRALFIRQSSPRAATLNRPLFEAGASRRN